MDIIASAERELVNGLAPVVQNALRSKWGENWVDELNKRRMGPRDKKLTAPVRWDVPDLLRSIDDAWELIREVLLSISYNESVNPTEVRSSISLLRQLRHRARHIPKTKFTDQDCARFLDLAEHVLRCFNRVQNADAINSLAAEATESFPRSTKSAAADEGKQACDDRTEIFRHVSVVAFDYFLGGPFVAIRKSDGHLPGWDVAPGFGDSDLLSRILIDYFNLEVKPEDVIGDDIQLVFTDVRNWKSFGRAARSDPSFRKYEAAQNNFYCLDLKRIRYSLHLKRFPFECHSALEWSYFDPQAPEEDQKLWLSKFYKPELDALGKALKMIIERNPIETRVRDFLLGKLFEPQME